MTALHDDVYDDTNDVTIGVSVTKNAPYYSNATVDLSAHITDIDPAPATTTTTTTTTAPTTVPTTVAPAPATTAPPSGTTLAAPATTAANAKALPFTGTPAENGLALGALFVLAGTAATSSARRRRR